MTLDEEIALVDDIQRYYLWVLSAIGIPSNILALVVIRKMEKMTTATFLIAALAVCDCCALVSKLIYVNLLIKETLTETSCKMDFIRAFFSDLANWTLVIICIERFVSVCYPLKKDCLLTLRRCYVIFGVMAAILFVPRMSLFIIMRYYMDDPLRFFGGSMCTTHDDYVEFWFGYWPWINNCAILVLPHIIIITFTIIMIVKLRMNAGRRREILTSTSPTSLANSNCFNAQILRNLERGERALTLMLTFTAVLFFVLTSPPCLYLLVYPYGHNFIFRQLQFVLFDSNHALNFFIYFLTAKRFRLQLYEMFRCERLANLSSRINVTIP